MGFVPAKTTNRPPESYELGDVPVMSQLPKQYFLPGTGPEPVDPGLFPKSMVPSMGALDFDNITPVQRIIITAGTAAGAYHGYKRNQSIGWAIGWGLLGGAFPILTTVIAIAQGYGKKKKGK